MTSRTHKHITIAHFAQRSTFDLGIQSLRCMRCTTSWRLTMNTIDGASDTGSFQNPPSTTDPTRNYRTGCKRGIAALLHDCTNHQETRSRKSRLMADTAIRKQSARCAPRGKPIEGYRARVRNTVSSGESDCTTLCGLVKNKEKFSESTSYLQGYIQRNAQYEIQKASAISIMATAISDWGCSITEAARRAADCTGFYPGTVYRWASAYFASSSFVSDENITEHLSSDRGNRDTHTGTLLHSEEFQLAACSFVRSNACRKGQPNLTSQMFADWIDSTYGKRIHDATARRWLAELGFSRMQHQKGVYFDGHDRDDVVLYRNNFLQKLDELDRISLTYDGTTPHLNSGERALIRVVHDESTYYANSDQTFFWGDDETNVLRQKSLGASIMVSDFIDEVRGFVRDGEESARLMLETSKDGYFTNDHLLKQVEKTLNIFERVHPECQDLFLFYNAPSHRKVADDTPNADKMNVGPGGKQPKMRDTVWQGQIQKMVDGNGIPRGMKAILEERGVDTTGMKGNEMRQKLKSYPDFQNQKTLLEDYIEQRGHLCLFYPKFHCELSPIERVWCESKKYTRAHANGTISRLRKIVPEGLDSVTVEQIKKYFRTCRDYERAYREGGTGREVEERVKVFKSHRRITTVL